jgi:ATP-binding cassette subfamily B protein
VSATTEVANRPTTSIWRLCWRVSQHEPRSFWIGWGAFVVFFAMPAANGFVLGRGFDALNDGDTSAVYRYAVLLAVV